VAETSAVESIGIDRHRAMFTPVDRSPLDRVARPFPARSMRVLVARLGRIGPPPRILVSGFPGVPRMSAAERIRPAKRRLCVHRKAGMPS
jgi:hypothetical protein